MTAAIRSTVSYRIARLCRRHRALGAELLAAVGLHPGPEMLLMELWAEDGLSQRELAERLEVRPPTITNMLHGLERAGLVLRRPDPQDGRVQRVHLTERGRGLEEPVAGVWAELEARTVAGMSGEERRRFADLLERVAGNAASTVVR